eukprot:15334640-Ditylum_brightwellii.AAC.1
MAGGNGMAAGSPLLESVLLFLIPIAWLCSMYSLTAKSEIHLPDCFEFGIKMPESAKATAPLCLPE